MHVSVILILVVKLVESAMDEQERIQYPEVSQMVNVVDIDSNSDDMLNISALNKMIHPEDFGTDFWWVFFIVWSFIFTCEECWEYGSCGNCYLIFFFIFWWVAVWIHWLSMLLQRGASWSWVFYQFQDQDIVCLHWLCQDHLRSVKGSLLCLYLFVWQVLSMCSHCQCCQIFSNDSKFDLKFQ